MAVQLLGVAVSFNLYLEEIHAELGLYHPATLFDPAYSPLLRQIAYLRPENLDLAWARGGVINWVALLAGVGLAGGSGLGLWGAWRKRMPSWMAGGLLVLLVGGALLSMACYAPDGDVAQAAHALGSMEAPGEAVALTEPGLTEEFQDSYDGHLWMWGVPSRNAVDGEQSAVWSAGRGDSHAAAARFQIGVMRLDYFPDSSLPFDPARLPVAALEDRSELGDKIELLAVDGSDGQMSAGDTLSLTLYWRALAPMDTSYTVFVHVIDEEGAKAGQVDRIPCDGGCPTATWRTGDLMGERYDLVIDADAQPGRYRIVSGMYDLATMENLPWLNAQGGSMGNTLVLGTVEVQ
jgi:hypothetical protein